VRLLKGEPFVRQSSIISTKLALPRAKPGGGVPENLTDTFAKIDAHWKLIYRPQAGRAGLKETELYDRRTDAADRNDVAAAHPDLTANLRAGIVHWMEMQQSVKKRLGPSTTTKLDTETLQRLRSLGYLGGKK
jgi:hypothetical protein